MTVFGMTPPAGPDRPDWTGFYAALYARLDDGGDLLRYLPAVLGELACGPSGERPEPRRVTFGTVLLFREAALDAVDENQRAYERAVDAGRYADHVAGQYNPWQEDR